jgi:nucleoside-diphosphate-sugar epimerase
VCFEEGFVRVVVAGGAGFIGSHLCDRLVAEGHHVTVLDNLITGNVGNIQHLLSEPSFRFVEHDIVEALPPVETDAIFNLASPASPPGYLQYPLKTATANSFGTYRLLELACTQGARFLMASTSEIYGEPHVHPQREDYWGNVNPVGMRSCYDESKRFAEMLVTTYRRHLNVDTRIVRIFNTYGPRSDPNDGRVVPNFVTQALWGQPMTVYGTGSQTRSLCYVSDLVDGLMRAMFRDGTVGGIFNLGNPDEHTIREFAEIIRGLAGSSSPIVERPMISEDDPSRRCPDISRAQRELGWNPTIDLSTGVTLTINWFRQELALRR